MTLEEEIAILLARYRMDDTLCILKVDEILKPIDREIAARIIKMVEGRK